MSGTYVLVPGAGGDSFYWHLVAQRLRDAGHDVVAPDLPAGDESAGLADYADAIVAAADGATGIVLVAQSMGAFPALMACERLDVASLVLVAAMIPAPGETPGAWWAASGEAEAYREAERAAGRDPDGPFDVHEVFLHDVPEPVVQALFARGEPRQADRPFGDPCAIGGWPDVPTRVIAGRHDRLMPLAFMQRLARDRVGVEAEVVDAGHLPALAAPDELTALLTRPG
jgi:pimeloyl-ACP methyl ester carboxylesterase